MKRPWTADQMNWVTGVKTVFVKRACNGCGRRIGDATLIELDAAIAGRELPDVRHECGCVPCRKLSGLTS